MVLLHWRVGLGLMGMRRAICPFDPRRRLRCLAGRPMQYRNDDAGAVLTDRSAPW